MSNEVSITDGPAMAEDRPIWDVPGQPAARAVDSAALYQAVNDYVDAIVEDKLAIMRPLHQPLPLLGAETARAHGRLADAAYALASRRAEARYAAETEGAG